MNNKSWYVRRGHNKRWKNYEQNNIMNRNAEETSNNFYSNNFYQHGAFHDFSRPPRTMSYPNLVNELQNSWNVPQHSRVPVSHQWRPPPPSMNESRFPANCATFFQNTQNKTSATPTVRPRSLKAQSKSESDSQKTLERPLKSLATPLKSVNKRNTDPPSLKMKPNLSSLKNTRLPQNLNKNKLLQIVNSSTTKFEPAMRELVRQKRLQLSRDLRNKYSSQTSIDQTTDILVPDMDVDLNSLPPQIISKLNNVLQMQNCDESIPENLKSEYEDFPKEFDNDVALKNKYNNLIPSSTLESLDRAENEPTSFFLLKDEENNIGENKIKQNELKENCGETSIFNEKTSDNIDDLFTLSNYGIELPSDVDELQLPSNESSLFNFTEIVKDLSAVDPFSKEIVSQKQTEIESHIELNVSSIETTNLSPIKKIEINISSSEMLDNKVEKSLGIDEVKSRVNQISVNTVNTIENKETDSYSSENEKPIKEISDGIITSYEKSNSKQNNLKEEKCQSKKDEPVFIKKEMNEKYEKVQYSNDLLDRNEGKSESNLNTISSQLCNKVEFSKPYICKDPENEYQTIKINLNENNVIVSQSNEPKLVEINCNKVEEHNLPVKSSKTNGLSWEWVNENQSENKNKETLQISKNNPNEIVSDVDISIKNKINFNTENFNMQSFSKSSIEDIHLGQNLKKVNKDLPHNQLDVVLFDSDTENINEKKQLSQLNDNLWEKFNESCTQKPLKQRLENFKKYLNAEVKRNVLVALRKNPKMTLKRRKIHDRKSKSNKNTSHVSYTFFSRKKSCEITGTHRRRGKLLKKANESVKICNPPDKNTICNQVSLNNIISSEKIDTNNMKESSTFEKLSNETNSLVLDNILNDKVTEKYSVTESNLKTNILDGCFELHKNAVSGQITCDKVNQKLKLQNTELVKEINDIKNHQNDETVLKQSVELPKLGITNTEFDSPSSENFNCNSRNVINNQHYAYHVKNNDKQNTELNTVLETLQSQKVVQYKKKSQSINTLSDCNIPFSVSHADTDLDYSEISSDQSCNDNSNTKVKNMINDSEKENNCKVNITINTLNDDIQSLGNNLHISTNKKVKHVDTSLEKNMQIVLDKKLSDELNVKNVFHTITIPEENTDNETKVKSEENNFVLESNTNESCFIAIKESKYKKKKESDNYNETKNNEKIETKNKEKKYLSSKHKHHNYSHHKNDNKSSILTSKNFDFENTQISKIQSKSVIDKEEILTRLMYIDLEIKKLFDEKFLLYKQLLKCKDIENNDVLRIINSMQINSLSDTDKIKKPEPLQTKDTKVSLSGHYKMEKNNLNFKCHFSDYKIKRPSSTCSEYSTKTSNKYSYKIPKRASSEEKYIKETRKNYQNVKYLKVGNSKDTKHISSENKLQFATLKRKFISEPELKSNKKKSRIDTDETKKKNESLNKPVNEKKILNYKKDDKRKCDKISRESIADNKIKQNNGRDKISNKEIKNKKHPSNISSSQPLNEITSVKQITENINKNPLKKTKKSIIKSDVEDFKSFSNDNKIENLPLINITKEKKIDSLETSTKIQHHQCSDSLKNKATKQNKKLDLHSKDLYGECENDLKTDLNNKHDTRQITAKLNENGEKKNISKEKKSETGINNTLSLSKVNLTENKLQDIDFQSESQIKKEKNESYITNVNLIDEQLDNNCGHAQTTELNLSKRSASQIEFSEINSSKKVKYLIKDCFIKLIPLEILKINKNITNKYVNNSLGNNCSNKNLYNTDTSKDITINENDMESKKVQKLEQSNLSQNLSNKKHGLLSPSDTAKTDCQDIFEITKGKSQVKDCKIHNNDGSVTDESKNIEFENDKKVANTNVKDEIFVMEIEKIKRLSGNEEIYNPITEKETIDLTNDNIDVSNEKFSSHLGAILYAKIYHDYLIVACEDSNLYKYNLQNGKLLAKGVGHTSAITCFNIIENQRKNHIDSVIYSGSLDGTFCSFALKTMEHISVNLKTDSPIQCMDTCWGYFFLGSNSGHLYRYTIQNEKLASDKREIADKPILVLKATREGSRRVLITAARNYPVSIRDAMSGLLLRYISPTLSPTIYSILLSDSIIYCGSSQNLIVGYDFTNGASSIKYTAGRGIVCLTIHKKLLFAGCYDGQVYVFNLKTQEFIISLPGPGSMILALDIIDDKIVVGCRNSKISIIEMPEIIKKSTDSVIDISKE